MRQPSIRHFKIVSNGQPGQPPKNMMQSTRAEDMEAMDVYAQELRQTVHTVQFSCTGSGMKTIRLKATRCIFNHSNKDGYIPNDAMLVPDIVCTDDITDSERHYNCFLFVLSNAAHV